MIRLLFLLMLYTTAAHAERPADYAFGVPLLPGDATVFQRVAVPAVVHEGTVKRDLADLRIFNGDGEVVPYAWIPRRPLPRGRPPAVALPMFPLYAYRDRNDVAGLALTVVRNASGATVRVDAPDSGPAGARVLGGYVLDASAQNEPLTALTFTLPEVAGVTTMRLRIDASDDLASWHAIAADANLVNLEYGGQRLTRNRIEFSPAKTKYLRLSWDVDRPAIEFSAVGGEFGERAVETPREWRSATGTAVANREGEYEIDLGGAFPVDRVVLELATPNSIVPAALSARASTGEPWQPIGSTVFYRLDQPDGSITSPPFPIAVGERRYWLLRIDPRSGVTGPAPPPMRAGWQPREIVFAARGRGPFTLAYGSQRASAGALPIATLVPGFEGEKDVAAGFAVARTGDPIVLGGQDRLRQPPDVRRWVLWVVLALGVSMLGWMAWRLSREMAASAKTDESKSQEPPRG